MNFYLGFLKGIYFDMAQTHTAVGDVGNSTAAYGQALAIDPYDAVIHNNIAINYMNLNEFEHAGIHFKKAIELDPRNILAMNNLGICYLRLQDLQQARAWFQKALAVAPDFLPAQYNLQRLLRENVSPKPVSSP